MGWFYQGELYCEGELEYCPECGDEMVDSNLFFVEKMCLNDFCSLENEDLEQIPDCDIEARQKYGKEYFLCKTILRPAGR